MLTVELARFIWMMGCVLQDACDNMPSILFFKLKLEAANAARAAATRQARGRLA
ncbi:MAG TPA: hypothetical protein VK363_11640 [Pyrinomonadaceae bacterium]|nr:hypothetical protein [Pyrinomonadaceae bacterium]